MPRKGDQRRDALLGALDELLRSRPLAEIGIAELAAAAGVTRSAFYFYFPTKAAAVAALMEDFYEQLLAAAADWYETRTGTPAQRLRRGFVATVELWTARAYLLAAMLDAAGTGGEVRAMWERWVARFIDRIAEQIAAERTAGIAHGEAQPHSLATVLMGSAIHAMEQHVRAIAAGERPDRELIPALVETWHRTIYF